MDAKRSTSTENLIECKSRLRLYKIRWYVILLASSANIINNFLWATWGPIAFSVKLVYDWSDNTLFWITNAGNIAAVLAGIGGVYIIDVKEHLTVSILFFIFGLRWAMLCCTFCLAVSATSRIITQTQPAATLLITIGQVFNGMGTSITMALPPVVSETWFHVNERTTATAVSCMSAAIGAGASFLFGPNMVSMPAMNGTKVLLNETDLGTVKQEVANLHYIIFGVSMTLFVTTVIYIPAKPQTAPSRTASLARYGFQQGLVQLIKTPAMWYIGCLYAIPMGTYGTWGSVLYPIIESLNFTQEEVGWIGFYGSVAGIVAALIIGRISDVYKRRKKLFLLILDTCAVVFFVWFTCMCVDLLPRSKAMIYVAAILGGMCVGSSGPLFLEITCEISYPISEGISAGFLAFILNLSAAVYLLITLIPSLEILAMNWVLCGVLGIAVPLLVIAKVDYQRVDTDTQSSVVNLPSSASVLH